MKIDRLIGIITILLQNDKTTAPALAERFEVSRRTIMRDIDTLCQAGIPVITKPGGDGGISVMDGYRINKSILTVDEMQNLVAGLKSIDSISKTSNFEQLMMKLAPDNNAVISLTDSIIIDLSSHYKDSLSEKISLIRSAVANKQRLSFDYYYSKGETRRNIEPYFIEFKWSAWYVFGWCRDREDFRRFKLNRLWNLVLLEDIFNVRPIPVEKANGSEAFPELYNVKILFDKSVKFRLIECYGLNSFEETEKGLLFSLGFTNKEYILSWILGFGDKAEIISPPELREEFSEIVKKTAAIYDI